MANTDYGPVPVSQLKAESGAIFDQLAAGRRVLVSKWGEIAAIIEPPTNGDIVALAAYARHDRADLHELTASDIANGSPSESVRLAAAGTESYLTKNDQVYGFIRPADPATLREDVDLDQLRADDARVAEHIARRGTVTEDELAALDTDMQGRSDSHTPDAYQQELRDAAWTSDSAPPLVSRYATGRRATTLRSPLSPPVAVDVYRDAERVWVEFDLPGVDAESIELDVEGTFLTVHALRHDAPPGDVQFLISEHRRGALTRTVALAGPVEANAMTATYEDGVLTVAMTAPVGTAQRVAIDVPEGRVVLRPA